MDLERSKQVNDELCGQLIVAAHECLSAGMTEILRMRPVLRYASLKVIEPRVKKVHWTISQPCFTSAIVSQRYLSSPSEVPQLDLFGTMSGIHTHSSLSNRAPVFKTLSPQILKGSSHAVILLASSGTRSTFSSSSVRVQVSAAIRPPALVPVITRGRRPASRNAFTTPQ